jgi:hypothetical protein
MGAVRGSGQGVVEGAEMEEGVGIAGGTGGGRIKFDGPPKQCALIIKLQTI